MFSQKGRIILASESPRRREMLEKLGLRFQVKPACVDESPFPCESPNDYVKRLARQKAAAVARTERGNVWVLGADTAVVQGGQRIYGKPADEREARAMLASLQGSDHCVTGAFALLNPSGTIEYVEVHSTRVSMRVMSDEEISAYVSSGEPLDKAGAYAIQGIGGAFVTGITGSFSNVIGLNIEAVVRALVTCGVLECARS